MAEGNITNYVPKEIVYASLTSVPSGVTLRNVSLRKQGNVVSGYIEVSAPSNVAQIIGTISNSKLYPDTKMFFPIWNANDSTYIGYLDISSSGEVKTHPISGLTGTKYIGCHVNYIFYD